MTAATRTNNRAAFPAAVRAARSRKPASGGGGGSEILYSE